MQTIIRRAAFFFLLTASTAAAQNNPEQIRVPFSDPGRPGTLEVRIFEGDVTIRAYEGREVIVTVRGNRGARSLIRPNTEAQGLRRLTNGGFAATEDDNIVSIRNDRPGDETDLDIQVPMRTNLKLGSNVDGDVVVEAVEGDIEVNNLNGGVTLTNVAGSVVAHSMNDDVKVTMRAVTSQKPMAFTSVNGNVDVTLPPSTRANLKMKTTNGDIYTDFDVQTQPAPPPPPPQPVETRGRSGRFRVDLGGTINGTINGGGPDFELRTVNGNVYIRRGR